MIALGSTPLTRQRTAQTLVDGEYVNGAVDSLTFRGSIQPLEGKERERLPEGWRERGGAILYTAPGQDIRPAKLGDAPDSTWSDVIVEADGTRWAVVSRRRWQALHPAVNHTSYVLALLGEDEP